MLDLMLLSGSSGAGQTSGKLQVKLLSYFCQILCMVRSSGSSFRCESAVDPLCSHGAPSKFCQQSWEGDRSGSVNKLSRDRRRLHSALPVPGLNAVAVLIQRNVVSEHAASNTRKSGMILQWWMTS
jgi:hypothetical protein